MKKYIIFDMDGTLIESDDTSFPIIFEHLKTYLPDLDYDYLKYYSIQTAGSPLMEQLKVIFKNTLDEDTLKKITAEVYAILTDNSDKSKFFPGIIDFIKELQKTHTLFLSTGNSDEYALKKMAEWGIDVCFSRIIGSSIIGKSSEHIKIFKEITQDPDFEKNAIFIWDWNTDREIARANNITFIKVWKAGIDTFEVDRTIQAKAIIESL